MLALKVVEAAHRSSELGRRVRAVGDRLTCRQHARGGRAMKSVTIDRKRPLRDEPKTGHNRWHPDIPPIVEVDEGEEVALETREATDGYLTPRSTEADFARSWRRGNPSADGTRPGEGRPPRRSARGRIRRHRSAAVGLHGHHARAGFPARHHDHSLSRPLGYRGWLGHLAPASRCAHSRGLVHGRVRRGAVARAVGGVDAARGRPARARRHGRSRPMPPAPCPPRGRRPFMDCGRCRRARTAGTST